MRRHERSQKLISEINITPFTDVILVLLIIFMVTTPLILRSSIAVQLPKASTTQVPPRDVNIVINSDGLIIVDNKQYSVRLDLDLLQFKLASLVKNNSDVSIIINGDKSVKYDFVMRVMDLAQQVWIRHIVLATEIQR